MRSISIPLRGCTSELGAVLADGMPNRVVIDMSGVEFCDSTGMNVLLSCLRRVRERGGELEIASPKPAVRKILQVTGLDSVFTLVDDANRSRPKPSRSAVGGAAGNRFA